MFEAGVHHGVDRGCAGGQVRRYGSGDARAHCKTDNASVPQGTFRVPLHADRSELGELFLQSEQPAIDAPRFRRLPHLREGLHGQIHRGHKWREYGRSGDGTETLERNEISHGIRIEGDGGSSRRRCHDTRPSFQREKRRIRLRRSERYEKVSENLLSVSTIVRYFFATFLSVSIVLFILLFAVFKLWCRR